jgi:putative transposase
MWNGRFWLRCREMGVRPSIGSVGNACDNAIAESFFTTLECELLEQRHFKNQAEAQVAVFESVEWDNPLRRYSSLGYWSPVNFERSYDETNAVPRPVTYSRPRARAALPAPACG